MKFWLVAAVVLLTASPSFAASDADTIAALKAELAALTDRLERLEQRSAIAEQDYDTPTSVPRAVPVSWTDRIRLKGDFRYRHESIDTEFGGNRNRQRVRARTALIADISDTVEVGFGLASGGDDPVSTNQTLGDGGSSKGVRIDLAYAKWATAIDGLALTGGKFKNPYHRTGGNGLLWDGDLNPEGLSVQYERGAFSASGAMLWANESSSGDDTLIFGGQMVWAPSFGGGDFLAGVGYYDIGVAGEPVIFDGDPRGNSVDVNGNYLFDYEELEAFAEFTLDVSGRPLTLFANYVNNLDAGDFDTGWAVGGKMQFSGRRPWQLEYIYQDLEADAVFALTADSDFIGGGTDGTGHIFKGGYDLTDRISLRGTLFINQRGDNLGVEEDYDRLMLDVSFKY